jgi:hypothetical protein
MATLITSLTGLPSSIGDLASSKDHVFRLSLPEEYSVDNVQTMRRDCEILGGILGEHPEEMVALLRATKAGDKETARSIIEHLGLSEKNFREQGGGWIWLLIGGAILLFSSEAF